MIEIDDKHKQVLQYAVHAYYENYLEMKKDKLEELEAIEKSLSEMRVILASLGYLEKLPSEDTISPKETTLVQQSGGNDSKRQKIEQIPPGIPKKSKKEQNQAGIPDNVVLRPDDLKLPAFEYDKAKMNSYKTIFFQELPDGRVVIEYSNAHYYTTKEAVMKIPCHPFPVKYFSKENGWSSTVEQAFKNYRKYLAEQEQDKPVIDLSDQAEQESIIEAQVETQVQEVETAPQPPVETQRVHHSKQIPISDALDMVSEMSDQGMLVSEMALRLNVTEETVNRYLKMIETKKRRHGKKSGGQTEPEPKNPAPCITKEGITEESGAQETESGKRDKEMDKPRLEFFKEDSGFDYASVNPQYIGVSTIYRSKNGKLVVKHQGKNTMGELLLTRDCDIEKLMNYDEKEVDWVIRSLSAEKRNILRGYLRDLKALNMVAQ